MYLVIKKKNQARGSLTHGANDFGWSYDIEDQEEAISCPPIY